MGQALIDLRNNASFAFWLINGLWVLFNYMITADAELRSIPVLGFEVNPLGFIFLIFFMAILFFQFIGMMIHRWGTFLQLISITEIPNPFRRRKVERNLMEGSNQDLNPTEALALTRELTKFEPAPDYSDSEGEEFALIPEEEDTQPGSVAEYPTLRRRRLSNPKSVFGTVRMNMTQRRQYQYSPIPDEVIHQAQEQQRREDRRIDLHPNRYIEEERRRRYLRGGNKATISRNFTVNNYERRVYRDRERRRESRAAAHRFPTGRRPEIPFDRRPSRHEPHRSDGWIPQRHAPRYTPGEEFDRQFQRRMHYYMASGGMPPQSRRY